MDLQMDLRVGFEESFSFDNHPVLACSSSSGSFSSASTVSSTHDPYTPTSGRSTPGEFRGMIMAHDSIACSATGSFGLTPPASAFGGYFSSEIKPNGPNYVNCEGLPATPSRKSSMQSSTAINFSYTPAMDASLASQAPLGSTQFLVGVNYSFADQVSSSHHGFSTPSFPLEDSNCDTSTVWGWASDSPVPFFEKRDSPAMLSSPMKDIPLPVRNSQAPSKAYLSRGRRRVGVEEIREKTAVIHKVQSGGVKLIKKSKYKCDHASCVGARSYTKKEHLKRHQDSKHNPYWIQCECCLPSKVREFNIHRMDNFLAHLKLHTQKQRPSSRTPHHPDAEALLAKWLKQRKGRSRGGKKREAVKDEGSP